MKKRIVFFLMTMFWGIFAFSISSSAYENTEKTIGNLKYTVDGKGITIVGFSGKDSYIYIPDQIDGKYVLSIGSGAFAAELEYDDYEQEYVCTNGSFDIEYIRLPNKLKHIGANAFYGCINLKSLVIPNSVVEINPEHRYAAGWNRSGIIQECLSLETLVMGNNLDTITEHTFSDFYSTPCIQDLSIGTGDISSLILDEVNASYSRELGLSNVYFRKPIVGKMEHGIYVKCKNYFATEKDVKRSGLTREGYEDIVFISPLSVTHAKVTFDGNGGQIPDINGKLSEFSEIYTLRGQPVSEEIPPEKEDCEFVGWYDNKACTGEPWDFVFDTVSSDITLYAKFRPKQYTVSFNAQGGSCDIKSKDYSFGLPMGDLPTPRKTNFQFVGWFSRAEANGECYDENTIMPRTNIKLYAAWLQEGKNLVVELDPNGGDCDSEKIMVGYGETMTNLPTPKLKGSKFLGWNTEPDGRGTTYTKVTPVKRLNLKLYAIWELKSYIVSLDPDGGTLSKTELNVKYNKPIGAIETPKRDGYEFMGWYYSNGKQFDNKDIMPANRITLKAKWRGFEYMILLDAQKGKCSEESMFVCCGDIIGNLPIPIRKNYQFKGWYTQAKGKGTLYTSDTEMPQNDITLYAYWKKISGYATSVKFAESKVVLGVGMTHNATAVTTPEYTLDTFTYKSSNTEVATVSATGVITAKKAGTAIITVTTTKGKTATMSVTVKKAVTSLKPSYTSRKLKKGQTVFLKVTPTGYAGTLKYTSSNTKVATVNQNGSITAVGRGKAIITISSYNGVKTTVTITVS